MSIGTLLIVIPFLAALIATISKTTKEGPSFPYNLTLVGWVLIGLAGTSATLNYLGNRDKATATAIREFHALRQIETAIYVLMSPIVTGSDPAELKHRFQIARVYGEAGVFNALCDTDIAKEVGSTYSEPEFAKSSWAVFIAQRTHDGISQLSGAQAAYGQIFSDEINSLIGQVIGHPWNEFLMASSRRLERIARSRAEKLLLCSQLPAMRQGYKDLSDAYWKMLRDLESRIGRRHCRLRHELAMSDAPPLFLRYISGPMYIPDPKKTEPIMKDICDRLAKSSA